MQDEFHVFCRFLLCDLLSFMPQSKTVRNIIYFITMSIIENNVHKTHKITKNAYFRTSVLKENKLFLPLMQMEVGNLQESANSTFNHENALKQI